MHTCQKTEVRRTHPSIILNILKVLIFASLAEKGLYEFDYDVREII